MQGSRGTGVVRTAEARAPRTKVGLLNDSNRVPTTVESIVMMRQERSSWSNGSRWYDGLEGRVCEAGDGLSDVEQGLLLFAVLAFDDSPTLKVTLWFTYLAAMQNIAWLLSDSDHHRPKC